MSRDRGIEVSRYQGERKFIKKMSAYISKEEKLIPISDPTGRWSELTLLPEWEEDIYDVYTVKI